MESWTFPISIRFLSFLSGVRSNLATERGLLVVGKLCPNEWVPTDKRGMIPELKHISTHLQIAAKTLVDCMGRGIGVHNTYLKAAEAASSRP